MILLALTKFIVAAANQKDYAIRMAQYFDYELKAGPKPQWMVSGIPYLHTAAQVSTEK
jgi:hypothetical protein